MAEGKGNDNLMGAVAYLLSPLTGIALLFMEKKSKFVRFHAMQSVFIGFGFMLLIIVLMVIPIIGWLLIPVAWIAGFVLWLVLMWKAFNGEMYKLPYVGELAEKQLAKMG